MGNDGFAMWLSGLQRCCRACWSCPWASTCLRVALGTSGQRSDWKPRFVRICTVTGHSKQFQKRFIGITKNVTILLSLVLLCFCWSSDCWGIEGDIGRVHLWDQRWSMQSCAQGPNSFQHSTLFGWLGCAGRCKSWWYNRSELSLARPNLQVNCGKLSFFLQPTEASRYTVHLRAPQRILRSSQSSSLGGARPENNQNMWKLKTIHECYESMMYDEWMNVSSRTLSRTHQLRHQFAKHLLLQYLTKETNVQAPHWVSKKRCLVDVRE